MAGGAIFPNSAFPVDTGAGGRTFPSFYDGSGGNASPYDEGLGVAASISTDDLAGWSLRFPMPPAIPSGTLKLRMLMLANATSGTAKITVSDAHVAAGSSPSAATLTAETQVSATWTTANVYVEAKVTLSSSPNANDMLVVYLTMNHTSWTLASVLTIIPSIIWE